MFSSPLQRAIARGMKPGGDLGEELSKLDDDTIHSRKDAQAICQALAKLPAQRDSDGFRSPLYALTSMFLNIRSPDAPAFEVLSDVGTDHLIRIFDARVVNADENEADDLLFVLNILALYRSREGAETVVEAARKPFQPDAYLWHEILAEFASEHPDQDYVFDALSDPLPPGFLAVSLLDSANRAAIEGELPHHPFDSAAGKQRLLSWLEDRDPEKFSYAHSATAALPFISNPERDQLLALAMDHADASVQMEAAWAAAKLEREPGFKMLVRFCLDPNHSSVAQRYLGELGREDLVPEEAQNPAFQAQAEFANWLAHPNELGCPPDELEIVDHRVLPWPPDGKPIPLWLIKFRLRDTTGLVDDDVGCGLVGSITFCLFSNELHQRPPEDAYAIHCYWEMECADLIKEVEVADPAEYAELLKQWRGAPLQDATVTHVAELSHRLNPPGRLVALASATLEGDKGWVVLDGPRSTWYPQADFPQEVAESTVLMLHVGRRLLGFQEQPDRKKYLITDRPQRDPHQIVTAYEKFMAEAENAGPERQEELLGSWTSLLYRHFDAYVESLMQTRGTSRPEAVIRTYDRFLQLARNAHESVREEVYDTLGVLGEQFEAYTDALIATGRASDVVPLFDVFAPYWDNNLGRSRLGGASFKIGEFDRAENYLSQLREEHKNYHHGDDMSWLAEIWHRQGKSDAARKLLIDCLRRLAADIQASEYASDRQIFAESLQTHRATYLRLFPGSDTELTAMGFPAAPE